jgi:2-polyprenyl-3-methyl-5-hydroxy-6-metoxy-1,4-benzoquinol methylase
MLKRYGDKTTLEHWDREWRTEIKLRLPSIWSTQSLVRKYAKAKMSYLELGCAPGKLLAWTASKFEANVSGLDYSENGMRSARALFSALNIQADLRCEDLFNTSFPRESFDLVTSFGLIEHFDDPSTVIQKHVELVKPGGIAIIAIPNYGGIYGRLQRKLDYENLQIHNLSIMTPSDLRAAVVVDNRLQCNTFFFGRPSLWILSLHRIMPSSAAMALSLAVSLFGLALPSISFLAPLIVLEIRKNPK